VSTRTAILLGLLIVAFAVLAMFALTPSEPGLDTPGGPDIMTFDPDNERP
jgi:hypothetical protein